MSNQCHVVSAWWYRGKKIFKKCRIIQFITDMTVDNDNNLINY